MQGDPVAVILPLTPLSAAVYFGIVLCGCTVVGIADSFAAHEASATCMDLALTLNSCIPRISSLSLPWCELGQCLCSPAYVAPSSPRSVQVHGEKACMLVEQSIFNHLHGQI